jgi:hypothetical protein
VPLLALGILVAVGGGGMHGVLSQHIVRP